MDVVIAAVCSGVVGIISGIGGAYVLVLKTKKEGDLKTQELQSQAAKEARADEAKTRRAEATEYKNLYNEVKAEVMQLKRQDRQCQRRCRRLELALARHGIEIPDLEDDDETGESPRLDPSGG